MGILAKILGLGPLFLAGLIIVALFLFAYSPQLAPLLPYMAILFPAFVLTLLVWRRAYPAAIQPIAGGARSPAFWYASSPDIPLPLMVNSSVRIIDGPRRPEENTLVFTDRARRSGYAVKVLRIADVKKNYETTTEHERMLLLDRMVKAVEGLSDVEAKLIIDRSPQGEYAYIILCSQIEHEDEEGAVHAVEAAAKTLATSLEAIGMECIDDVSYMGYKMMPGRALTVRPSRSHAYLLGVTSAATVVTSIQVLGLEPVWTAVFISGVLGLATAYRALSMANRASCGLCGEKKRHIHWMLGWSEEGGEGEVGFLENGVLVWRRDDETIASKYISITANNNRDLSTEDIDKRLPMYLANFSSMIYSLKDFRIALHIVPQPVGDTIKLAMARADLYGMDAQVGGAVSGYLKAGRSMNVADRITHGERPYLISGVVEVRCRTNGEVSWRNLDTLDKQAHEARSILDTMNLSTKEVRDGWGAGR